MPKRSRIGELNAAGFVVAPTKVKGGISIDRILEFVSEHVPIAWRDQKRAGVAFSVDHQHAMVCA